jgi:hypothetical protein
MTEQSPSFMRRLALAFSAFFRVLFNASFAGSIQPLLRGPQDQPTGQPTPGETPVLLETSPASALQLLGLLQQEGRLVDFLEEDVAQYTDAEIGAAVRVVHEGCRKTLHEHLSLQPIRQEAEGSKITLEAGFDAAAMRPTGNLVGHPPFTGTLAHRGWRVTEVRLPKLAQGHDVQVIAPAEVEL